jgi:hypothetical protein
MNTMTGKRRDLPDHATRCLTCACENRENHAATDLLRKAEALSATGVIAAIFLADSEQHRDLTLRARHAIAEQREWCDSRGPFNENCPIHARRG